jgi:uncharacterized membrane protein YeaQ/YmgE (transglycosylase-associated protein family)
MDMGILLALILLVVLLGVGMWFTVGVIGLLLTLVVAGFIGWLADVVVPGKLPGGWIGAVLAGIAGGWIGQLLFGLLNVGLGPQLFGIHVIPAFVGAVLIAGAAEILTSRRALA